MKALKAAAGRGRNYTHGRLMRSSRCKQFPGPAAPRMFAERRQAAVPEVSQGWRFCARGLAVVAAVLLCCAPATAQYNPGTPKELENIGITEQLGAQLPLDLPFVNEQGHEVRLGDFFNRRRPVILVLNYYSCPTLCGLLLNGMLDGIRPLDWTPGQDYEIVTLSFDPLEKPELARGKKRVYLNEFGRPGAGEGWHFLTGRREPIRALTDAVGFRYAWNEKQQEWAHSAALIFCSPSGRVTRYLGGVMFEPQTVRRALIEAGEGTVGSLFDQIFMTCFMYDADAGRYTASAVAVMRLGGGLTLAALSLGLLVLWRTDVARRERVRRAGPAGSAAP